MNTNSNWKGDNAFQGLCILNKYVKNDENVLNPSEHDIIYSIGVKEAIEAGITEEDVEKLARLNWIIYQDSFVCYV